MKHAAASDRDYDEATNGPDPTELLERQAEEAREQQWTAFVAHLTDVYRANWATAFIMLSCAYESALDGEEPFGDGSLEDEMRQFAETEGWHGVVGALARAMKEHADLAAEIERRR